METERLIDRTDSAVEVCDDAVADSDLKGLVLRVISPCDQDADKAASAIGLAGGVLEERVALNKSSGDVAECKQNVSNSR